MKEHEAQSKGMRREAWSGATECETPQSATQVNTIRPGKLARLLGVHEAKSAKERNQRGSPSTEKGRRRGLSSGWWWNGGRSNERATWETCPGVRSGVHAGKDWPKNRTGAGVRASVVAQASREATRTEPNGPKASNDRWSQGTQEDGLRRKEDE